eukprot:8687694-Pyramimonas_sp.AAC.2
MPNALCKRTIIPIVKHLQHNTRAETLFGGSPVNRGAGRQRRGTLGFTCLHTARARSAEYALVEGTVRAATAHQAAPSDARYPQ